MQHDYLFWDGGSKIHYEFDRRTDHTDWMTAVTDVVSKLIRNTGTAQNIKILDIGAGDGLTTKQITDKLTEDYNYKIIIDAIEPSRTALDIFCKQKFNKNVKVRSTINSPWVPEAVHDRYDLVFLVHSAYYLANTKEEYEQSINSILSSLTDTGICILFLNDKNSGFYKIAPNPAFDKWTYPEETGKIIRKTGHKIDSKRIMLRLFVGDLFNDDEKLLNFWRYVLNNKNAKLNETEKNKLINKLRELSKETRGNHILLKDDVLFVTPKN